MDNIYGQDDALKRNSIAELPSGYAEDAGNTLYSWLGSIWRSIHRGDDMVRGLQKARGMRLAQLYLDLLEAAKLQDRNGAPVFHRELWHPIVIRRSERNKSQENMLVVGVDAQLGPQEHKEPYGVGTVLKMGRLANYADFVTYPITKNIVGMSTTIVDNIINPTVVMHYDNGDGTRDFEFRNNSIIFPKELDPLAAGSEFEKYDLPNLSLENPDDPNSPMVSDIEAILWASDVLIDRNYIAEHLSYPLGAVAPSSEIVKRIINAAWSSVSSGLTPELIRTLMAAMLNIPVIQHDKETVVDIVTTDKAQEVYTDKGLYRVSLKAKLIKGLYSGCVLNRGDLLDESLRVYPYLNGICGEKVSVWPDYSAGSSSSSNSSSSNSSNSSSEDEKTEIIYKDTGFSVPLEQDIPSIVLSPNILRVKTEYGIYAMWGFETVKRDKASPGKDSNPHLYFDVGGTEKDCKAFWDDIWKHAESASVSMSSILGKEGDKVSPAAFFLKHFVGANTIFVVVDDSQLENVSLMRDPMFFGMLSSVVPSSVRLFLVEHRSVGDDDKMELGEAQEETFLAAALPEIVENVSASVVPGKKAGEAYFEDHVMMKFVRPAPVKVRVRKEEE